MVLFHSKDMPEMGDDFYLQPISSFLSDASEVVDKIVTTLEDLSSKINTDRIDRLERFMTDLARQMEEDQEDWNLKTLAGNIRHVLNS